MDLVVRKAKIFGKDGLWDVGVKDGFFYKISKEIPEKSKEEILADGNLMTPTFIDPHIHLDKILISETVRDNVSGTLTEAIEIIWERKRNYDVDEIVERASKVVEWAIKNGTTIMRSHADVDTIGGLKPVEALLKVKEKYRDVFDLQVVAFPQEGIIQDPGTSDLMEEAIKMGCDVVGGMPYNEMIYDDSKRHIDFCFSLAQKYNRDIDMHVDETDDEDAHTLEYYAAKTIKEGYEGRVTACHTCALSSYNEYKAAKVINLIKRAKMTMETNPATNLMLQGRMDQGKIRRGLTRVKELLSAGVNVTYGQDCIKDTFYPTFGQADLLEVGQLLAHAAHLSMPSEVEKIMYMITYNAALQLRLDNYGIEEGKPASFNVLGAKTVQEAFRTRADRLYVVKKGKILAKTKTTSELFV